MKINKIKLKRAGEFFKKLPLVLGENAFFAFLGGLVVCLILGGIILYQYFSLANHVPKDVEGGGSFEFKEAVYQQILEEWQAKTERLIKTDSKEYSNPFKVD